MTGGRALVVCLDTLGDLTLRQPLLSGLLDAGLAVEVLVRDRYAPLVPFLDARLAIRRTEIDPYRAGPETAARLRELRESVLAQAPDLVVFPAYTRSLAEEWLLRTVEGLRTAAFEAPLAPAARTSLAALLPAADTGAPAQATIAVSVPEDDHETRKNAALGAAIAGHALPEREPVLTLPASVRDEAAALLSKLGLAPGRFAYGGPGGTANNRLKGWPVPSFAAQVAHLHRRHGLPVLLSGLPEEADHLQAIAAAAAAQDVPTVTHLGEPERLPLLLGLVAHSRLYVGTDTGPMHFAGALGVPVVAVFGGGHWPRFLPRARRSFVATQELPCFGCGWDCWLPSAACITTVDARAVDEGIDWILGTAPDERRIHRGRPLDPVADEVIRGALAVRRSHEQAWRESLERAERDAAARLAEMERLGRSLRESDEARRHDVEELTRYVRQLEGDVATLNRVAAELQQTIAAQQAVLARRSVKLMRKLGLA